MAEQIGDLRHLRRSGAAPRLCVTRIHEIGRLGTDQAVEALVKMVRRLEGPQQMAAVHAIYLANSNYANEQLRLLAAHRRSEIVRRQACRDLLLAGQEHRIFLRDVRLLVEPNLMIRGEVLRGLLVEDVLELEKAVMKAVKSKNPVLASAGAFGVGHLQLKEGAKYLEDGLESSDIQLRRNSIQALGSLGGPHSYLLLLEAWSDGTNLMFREDIAAALQKATQRKEVEILIKRGLRDPDPELVRICADIVATNADDSPSLCNPALTNLLEHEDEKVRDLAMEGLVNSGSDSVRDLLIQRLESNDARLRSDAMWALSQLGNLPVTVEPRILELAASSNTAERVQAANVLRRFPRSTPAFEAVTALLEDDAWPVRSMATESMLAFRRTSSLPALVKLANEEYGRVREDAIHCLTQLSGEDVGPIGESWALWLKERPEFYQLPSARKAVAMLHSRKPKQEENQHSVVRNTYHGLDVAREGVVFVLDVSGSMSSRFNDRQTYYQHFASALDETISHLPADTQFNVVLFSSSVKMWRNELVSASADNIMSAKGFLEQTQPGGGTNLHSALMASLSFESAQTVYLLTDGNPTIGPMTAPDAILSMLERSNRNRRIRFHTIAAGSVQASFLAELATANGGKAVDLTDSPE
ncbi:MAG: VWA domain-containing protein [Planctomycetes bacterium]|nr:VWA domain-containing protein [Planctomycetota bacterium]MCP4769884.1 VWA domain-containing protein [Planctomycetota bacterium]MCP4859724.1 VWA domain-containing protein [Planctomycetota bacterium]